MRSRLETGVREEWVKRWLTTSVSDRSGKRVRGDRVLCNRSTGGKRSTKAALHEESVALNAAETIQNVILANRIRKLQCLLGENENQETGLQKGNRWSRNARLDVNHSRTQDVHLKCKTGDETPVKRTAEARNRWVLWETAAPGEGTDTDSSESLWCMVGRDRKGIWLSTWDETHFPLSQEEREGEEVRRLRIERFLQSRRMEFKVTFLLSSDRSFAYLALEGKPELATYVSSTWGQGQAWGGTKKSHLLKDTFHTIKVSRVEKEPWLLAPSLSKDLRESGG